MNYYYGKTVENALETGLADLGVSKEQVIVTVISEGNKGILGIGGDKAKIGLELKTNNAERVCEFLDGLFEKMNITAQTESVKEEDCIKINVITTSSSAVIGYRGEVLVALQTLASAVANIGNDEYVRVSVDCENYRAKREETLKNLALRLANKAITNKRKVRLEPMNPFERRIIHSVLADEKHVKTESEGVEPNRYIVIIPDEIEERNSKYGKGGKNFKTQNKGFKSEMIKITTKTAGYGTFLGNSLKDEK